MAHRRIISVAPASGRGESVVVEVLQVGLHPLDLRLVGCDGENPYVATIKHRNLGTLKHKYKGSEADWATVVSHFLLQQPVASNAGILHGVSLVHVLQNDLALSFRQEVQGIKVVLGEIVLPRDDDFELNPFDWARASANAHSETLRELTQLKSRTSGELDAITKLNAQLDDFIKAKTETEAAMLQQFLELLNRKKRKIRDQSRLLAGAKVDQSVASDVQSSRRDAKPRKAGGSRHSKRKAPAQAEPGNEPDSESDQMELDQAKEEEQATPDPSDNETDEEEVTALLAREMSSEKLNASSAAHTAWGEATNDGNPPPRRELPFGRAATRSKGPPKDPSPPADEDEDTEDEEL